MAVVLFVAFSFILSSLYCLIYILLFHLHVPYFPSPAFWTLFFSFLPPPLNIYTTLLSSVGPSLRVCVMLLQGVRKYFQDTVFDIFFAKYGLFSREIFI